MHGARRLVAALGLVALVVAGCSDDDPEASSTETTSVTGPTDGTTTQPDATTPVDDGSADPGETDSPGVDLEPLPPVGVGEAADFGEGFLATVTKVQGADLEARAPGEIAGPGILVTVELQNDTDETIDLSGIAVNASYGDGAPAIPHQTGANPFTGTLVPGERTTATYAFRVPQDQVGSVVVDIHHATAPGFVVVEVDAATA